MTASNGNEAVSELQPAVKELCRTLDGFVYVVDATEAADHSLCLHLLFILHFLYIFVHFQLVISSC